MFLIVLFGSSKYDSEPNQLWWFVIFSMPVSFVTFLIAVALSIPHSFAKGTPSRKFASGVAVIAASIFATVVIVLGYEKAAEARVKSDDEAYVVPFVLNHRGIRAQFGNPQRLVIEKVETYGRRNTQYTVSLGITPSAFAIVGVWRIKGRSQFQLDCVTTTPINERSKYGACKTGEISVEYQSKVSRPH